MRDKNWTVKARTGEEKGWHLWPRLVQKLESESVLKKKKKKKMTWKQYRSHSWRVFFHFLNYTWYCIWNMYSHVCHYLPEAMIWYVHLSMLIVIRLYLPGLTFNYSYVFMTRRVIKGKEGLYSFMHFPSVACTCFVFHTISYDLISLNAVHGRTPNKKTW